MKGFEAGSEIVIAIFLTIIVLAFLINFLFTERIQAGDSGSLKEEVKCKTHSDCPPGQLCITINDQPRFCGCLDEDDCLGEDCIYNMCPT